MSIRHPSGGVCGHHLVVYLENVFAESFCLDFVTLKIMSGLNRSVPVGTQPQAVWLLLLVKARWNFP